MIDVYADEYEPVVSEAYTVYGIRFPRPAEVKSSDIPYFLWVGVDNYGVISLESHTHWYGKREPELDWVERMAIYEFLVEWELAEWRNIGPEDRELFATKKLSQEHGLE